MTDRRLFGSDGVRGRMGEAPMTPEMVMHLGYAAGRVLLDQAARQRRTERPAVLIGSDTRSPAYLFEAALGAGFSATGVDVMHSGPLPPPAVAYLTRLLHLSAGIVVRASHPQADENGLQFFSSEGHRLAEAVEHAIEEEMAAPMACVPAHHAGISRRVPDPGRRYIDFCKSSFPAGRDLHGLRLVVRGAQGAGGSLAPQLFRELGAEVLAPDPGPGVAGGLAQAVRRHGAVLGIALDGDGDRLRMVDADGASYGGDPLLYVIARQLRRRGELGGGVVGTLMSNLGLEHALSDSGIPFARAAGGDRAVLALMAQRRWRLGGESSGRILCADRHATGDGLIAALQVLAALQESGRTLAQLTQGLTLYPQHLRQVRVAPQADWRGHPAITRCQIEVETALAGTGRVMLCRDDSEPLLRVLVEAPEPVRAAPLARRLADVVAAELGGEVLGDAAPAQPPPARRPAVLRAD